MQREAKEELGVELILGEMLLDYVPEQPEVATPWRTVVFSARIKQGIPIIAEPDACTDLRWVEKAALKRIELTTYAREDFSLLGWL